MNDRLTQKQGFALVAIESVSSLYRNGGWVDLPTLARLARTSPEGLSYSLGSLVRRGLVAKCRLNHRMHYRLTPFGGEIDLSPWKATPAMTKTAAKVADEVVTILGKSHDPDEHCDACEATNDLLHVDAGYGDDSYYVICSPCRDRQVNSGLGHEIRFGNI